GRIPASTSSARHFFMSEIQKVIRSRRIVLDDRVRPATIGISDGTIAAVGNFEDFPHATDQFDFGDSLVMPGVVDSHVNFNDPGRTDWEGFRSATRAAAAGGITSMIEM